jgi:hypothetical protein
MRSLLPWFIVGMTVQTVVAVGLLLWARWVARRRGTPGWRRAAWLPALALVLNVAGVAATAWLLDHAPPSPGRVGPEARRAYYRQWTGPGAVGFGSAGLAALLYATSAALSLVGTARSGGPTPPREASS